MGKTNPTYRDRLQEERGNWETMRRGLRDQHRDPWDAMWLHAEQYSGAIGEANPRHPIRGILMSTCLGQQVEIRRLEERLSELEKQ